jgi:hypothetical protein
MYGQNKLIATNVLSTNKTYTKNGQYRKVTVKNLKKNLPVKTGPQKQLVSGKITEKDLSFVPATKESLSDLESKTQYQIVSSTNTIFSGGVKVQNDKVATKDELQAEKISYTGNLFPSNVKTVESALDYLADNSGGGGTFPSDQDLYKNSNVTFMNLTLTDVTTGMLKTATGKIEFATPDKDYATESALNTIAGEAIQSANDSKNYADQASQSASSSLESEIKAADSEKNALESKNNAELSKQSASVSASASVQNVLNSIEKGKAALDSSNTAAKSASQSAISADAANDILNTIQSTGLNSLPNNGPVDFSNYKGINVANGDKDTDIATFEQIRNLVQSVTGTPGSIEVTSGTTPVISLATTGVVAKSYKSANITVDKYRRITIASDGSTGGGIITINGTSPIVASTTTSGTCTIGLSTTTVTPNTYTAPTIVVDAYGRVTAATSTTPVQEVKVGGTLTVTGPQTAPIIDLTKLTVTPGDYTAANIRVDAYGRVTSAITTTPRSTYPMTFAGNHNSNSKYQYFAAYAIPTTSLDPYNINSLETIIIAPFDGYISTIYVSRTTAGSNADIYININKTNAKILNAINLHEVFTKTEILVKANDQISVSIFISNFEIPSNKCLITLLLKST